jgi:hypothetical protein
MCLLCRLVLDKAAEEISNTGADRLIDGWAFMLFVGSSNSLQESGRGSACAVSIFGDYFSGRHQGGRFPEE